MYTLLSFADANAASASSFLSFFIIFLLTAQARTLVSDKPSTLIPTGAAIPVASGSTHVPPNPVDSTLITVCV